MLILNQFRTRNIIRCLELVGTYYRPYLDAEGRPDFRYAALRGYIMRVAQPQSENLVAYTNARRIQAQYIIMLYGERITIETIHRQHGSRVDIGPQRLLL